MADIRLKKHANYTLKELEGYLNSPNSCVHKINTNFHVSILPYSMENFKRHLLLYIIRKKVSFYDAQVDGIVLDVRNIKLLNSAAALRGNDPHLHVDLNADFYVFRPAAGALVNGLVKYVGDKIVGVTIYKVFSAQIRFNIKIDKSQVCLDQELQFRIKDFDLQNVFPYIVGELPNQSETQTIKKERVKKITFEQSVSVKDEEDSNETQDLEQLVALIKEQTSEQSSKKRKNSLNMTPTNGRRKLSASSTESPDIKIKSEEDSFSIAESDSIPTKKKRKIRHENSDASIDIKIETEEKAEVSNTIIESSSEQKVKHKKHKKRKNSSLEDKEHNNNELSTSNMVSISLDSGDDYSNHENSFQIKLSNKKAKKKLKKESLANGTTEIENDSTPKINGEIDCVYID